MKNSIEEIWKDIPEYEGLYQASNLGRIKSLSRKVLRNTGVYENRSGRILKPFNNGKGYKSVQLYKEGIPKRQYVHRLVLLSFLGNSEGMVVDHIDRDRGNNILSNLRYCSARENTKRGTNKNPTSKYIGVSISKRNTFKKWKASIRILDKRYFIGSFEKEKDAAEAYQKALRDWKEDSITPKGEKLEKRKTNIFKSKSLGSKGNNAKTVIDTNTGVFYESLKEASKFYPQSYKYLSNAILHKPHKTPLRYV